MANQKNNDYFAMFVHGVSFACQAADMLHANLTDYRPEVLRENIEALHTVEHNADIAKHELMGKLLREFITPIDREDIIDLANSIDDVTDAIEDVLVRLYMFNVQTMRTEAEPFAKLILQCCQKLSGLLEEFGNFRKSKTIREHIIALNQLEEEGDKLYLEAVRRLYCDGTNVAEQMAWTTLLELLEKCCDSCEDVADVVERVILKNS